MSLYLLTTKLDPKKSKANEQTNSRIYNIKKKFSNIIDKICFKNFLQ